MFVLKLVLNRVIYAVLIRIKVQVMCYQWAAYLQILIPKPNYPRHKNVIKIPCKFIYVLS